MVSSRPSARNLRKASRWCEEGSELSARAEPSPAPVERPAAGELSAPEAVAEVHSLMGPCSESSGLPGILAALLLVPGNLRGAEASSSVDRAVRLACPADASVLVPRADEAFLASVAAGTRADYFHREFFACQGVFCHAVVAVVAVSLLGFAICFFLCFWGLGAPSRSNVAWRDSGQGAKIIVGCQDNARPCALHGNLYIANSGRDAQRGRHPNPVSKSRNSSPHKARWSRCKQTGQSGRSAGSGDGACRGPKKCRVGWEGMNCLWRHQVEPLFRRHGWRELPRRRRIGKPGHQPVSGSRPRYGT